MTTRHPDLTRWLIERVCERTGLRPEEVDVDLPLRDLGLGSIAAEELAAELSTLLGTPVHPALAYAHPTVRALAEALTGGRPAAAQATAERLDGPIAITGMSVRVPGADSASEFWQLLRQGRDPIAEVPADRWRLDPEALTEAERGARFAGLLSDIASFDAGFFRIPSEEAMRMDPQQRLLLEGAWEALEDAGTAPDRLAGSRTGVYVGISNNDYVRRQLGTPAQAHALTPTGNALSIAANRLSYLLDLRGPSLAVDTACSSSLVAVHLAAADLRSGGCELAVAAGVNLLVEPDASVALARAGMLAPDGRCKPFDASANGYVRSEGCIVVVLKPLERAFADGDRVYAVILGSHANQDGRSNGLTAPNPAAQVAVLRGACADAAVDPSAVHYVECHGTGTLLGDPIEARALGEVFGAGRPAGQPCLIGSVKSNVGHLESAAGLAGLVKVALSLHHGSIPGTLHLRAGNPRIDFAQLGLRIAGSASDWPASASRLAGVSSFGFGGTNAHVLLGGAPPQPSGTTGGADHGTGQELVVLPVSARHPESLAAAAQALADQLGELDRTDEAALPSVAAALSVRRSHHNWRYAAVGSSAAELAAELREVRPDQLTQVRAGRRLFFAFPGQVGHACAALLTLAQAVPVAAATLRRCDEVIEEAAGWSLLEVLRGIDADRVLREDTVVAQPAAVAAQLTLAAAWRGVGIKPAGVIGHSLGEVSAAAVAGSLSLEQALMVALARGRVISKVIGTGKMLAVAVGEREAEKICASAGDRITIATVNAPGAVVLAGSAQALDQVRVRAEAGGTLARWVPVDYPSHGPGMDSAAADLTEALGGLDGAAPALPFWSSADAGLLTTAPDAVYWGRNLRSPVRFADAASALLADGPVTVVEIGAHPVLRMPLAQLAALTQDADLAFVATMERGADPVRHFRSALARLYELGADPRWDLLVPRTRYWPVPTYRWRRDRYWLPRQQVRSDSGPGTHPLLGRRLELASPAGRRRQYWELRLTGEPPAATAGHLVGGRPVLPGAGYLEIALAAGRQLGIDGPIEVRDARFITFLPLAQGPLTMQTIAESSGSDQFDVTVMSRGDDGDWQVNATATVARAGDLGEPAGLAPVADPATARATCFHPIATSAFYDALSAIGLDYTDGYRALDDIWYGEGTAVAALARRPGSRGFVIDPATLDGAFQLTAAASGAAPDTRPVLHGVRRLVVTGSADADLSAVVRVGGEGDGASAIDVAVFAGQRPVITVGGMRVTAVTTPAGLAADRELHWYEPAWRRRDAAPGRQALDRCEWVVVTSGAGIGEDVTARLRDAGARVRILAAGDGDWRALLADLGDGGTRTAEVVYLPAPAAAPDARQVGQDVLTLAALIKAASASDVEVHRLWVVTAGSQPVPDEPAALRPGHGALWGLVKVLPFENPNLHAYCVDLDAVPDRRSVDGLIAEFGTPSPDGEIALRGGRRYVARIVAAAGPGEPADPEVVRPGGSYLITGGLGAIGLRVACWLSRAGASSLGLLGRTPPGQAAQRVIADLERAGTKIGVFTGDVADLEVVSDAAARLRASGPIRGVVHAAGVLRDGALLDMADAAIESVLRPKVAGTICLAEATAGDPLDWVVYFSSAASMLGSPGQANYCAANAFIDAYGAAERAQGRPAIVVNWGAWADAGLAARVSHLGAAQGRLSAAYAALDPEDGIDALAAIVRARAPRAVVLASDLRHLARLFPAATGGALFSELGSGEDVMLRDIGLGAPRYARPALKQPYEAPRNEIERRIAGIWQRSLGFHRVGVKDGFFELGGDSVFANQMLLEVNRTIGVGITAAEAFDDLTVARLAELAEQDMVRRLASMSDEEAERLLRGEEDG